MYSFSGGQQRGATLPQLRCAVLNPEMAPPFVSDALDRMTRRLWYLYQDAGLYRFESRPNLNRILVDREEMIRSEPDKVRDFAKTILNDLIGDATFRVYRYPEEDRDVADEPRLSLVVLDLHQGAAEDELPPATEQFVTGVLKQHGKGFRKHANMLIFLVQVPIEGGWNSRRGVACTAALFRAVEQCLPRFSTPYLRGLVLSPGPGSYVRNH